MIKSPDDSDSPIWNGFQIKAGYSSHAHASDDVNAPTTGTLATANNRVFSTGLHYANGPFVAGTTYEYNKAQDYTGVSSTDSGNTWNIAAAYDFGVVRIGGAYGTINYAQNPGVTRDDRKQWHLGVSAPITPNDVIALNYAHATIDYNNGSSDDSINSWGIGYLHSLSKRTTLYAAYDDINQNSSNVTRASFASTSPVNNSADNAFLRAFAVGLRHDF